MKKLNLIIIATIIATFVFSMLAFQPTTTGASNNAAPSASPNGRRIIAVPTTTRKPIRKSKTKAPKGVAADDFYKVERIRKPKNPVLSARDLDGNPARRSKQIRNRSTTNNTNTTDGYSFGMEQPGNKVRNKMNRNVKHPRNH